MAICGLLFFDAGSFAANLPKYANGMTVDQLATAAQDAGLTSGFSFAPESLTSWPVMFMASIMLFQFIGFQYSAYISGEVRGNVKRGVLIAVLGALATGGPDELDLRRHPRPQARARRPGRLDRRVLGVHRRTRRVPLGQGNYFQLVGAIARPDLWPIWTVVGAASTLFPFLLMPVYVIFISRIALAWSLDRQVPEWFGAVSERLRAPSNAIFAALALAVVFLLFSNFSILKWIGLGFLAPNADPNMDGKLNLVASAWFTVVASGLAWIMPGVNALLARFTRPDLVKDAPFLRWLPWLGSRLAGVHAHPVLVRGPLADPVRRHRRGAERLRLPQRHGRVVRPRGRARRHRLVRDPGVPQPAGRRRDGAHVPDASARLTRPYTQNGRRRRPFCQ